MQDRVRSIPNSDRVHPSPCRVESKMSSLRSPYTVPEAQAIIEELTNIDRSLTSGEREKRQLLECLSQLKYELQRLQPPEPVAEDTARALQLSEKLSIASQTDLSGDVSTAGQPAGFYAARILCDGVIGGCACRSSYVCLLSRNGVFSEE